MVNCACKCSITVVQTTWKLTLLAQLKLTLTLQSNTCIFHLAFGMWITTKLTHVGFWNVHSSSEIIWTKRINITDLWFHIIQRWWCYCVDCHCLKCIAQHNYMHMQLANHLSCCLNSLFLQCKKNNKQVIIYFNLTWLFPSSNTWKATETTVVSEWMCTQKCKQLSVTKPEKTDYKERHTQGMSNNRVCVTVCLQKMKISER